MPTNRYFLSSEGLMLMLETQQELKPETVSVIPMHKMSMGEVMKPFPNEHACRQSDPDQFTEFRRGSSDIGGKPVSVIYGLKAGEWVLQSYRFPTEHWTAAEARSQCSGTLEEATTKSAQQKGERFERTVRIAKADQKRQLVYGVALEPNRLDSYLDWESVETIELTAHRWMLEQRAFGIQHHAEVAARPVESYCAPCNFWFKGTERTPENEVIEGSWVLVSKVFDPEVFDLIEKGELTGYSIQGWAYRDTNADRLE